MVENAEAPAGTKEPELGPATSEAWAGHQAASRPPQPQSRREQ